MRAERIAGLRRFYAKQLPHDNAVQELLTEVERLREALCEVREQANSASLTVVGSTDRGWYRDLRQLADDALREAGEVPA